MEVLVQDVKPETIVPDAEEPNQTSQQHRKITLLSAGTTIPSGTFINRNSHQNNFVTSSTPVRTTTLSGQQLQTMAKSSGLSIVHVTLPQVADRSDKSSQSFSDDDELVMKTLLQPSSLIMAFDTNGYYFFMDAHCNIKFSSIVVFSSCAF